MASNKIYWKSIAELDTTDSMVKSLRNDEFVEEIPVDEFLGDKQALDVSKTSRRDFLKYVGFSTAAATLAACEGPVKKSIPYVVQPEQIRPGVANYYATSIADGYDFSALLVKTREGRPIKIENNKEAKFLSGANARVHASVLSLYDNLRLKDPKIEGRDVSWEEFNTQIKGRIKGLQAMGKSLVLFTQTFASPSTTRLIDEFRAAAGNVRHVTYDAISESSALDAFQALYGMRALPDYDFSKADLIVGIGADFLGDWYGGGFDKGYAQSRVPKNGRMSHHVQLEANMTLTGSNADKRIALSPSVQKLALATLAGYVLDTPVRAELPAELNDYLKELAKKLKSKGSSAVVVTGLDSSDAHLVAMAINDSLGSAAMDVNNPRFIRSSSNTEVQDLIADMKAGRVGGLITVGVNPGYSLPNSIEFIEAFKKLSFSASFSLKEDETSSNAQFIGALPHYLESWGDVEMKKGNYNLIQPTIKPLFNTMQFQDCLLNWMNSDLDYYNYVKTNWVSNILVGHSWNQALHDGYYMVSSADSNEVSSEDSDQTLEAIAGARKTLGIEAASRLKNVSSPSSSLELILYPKIGMGDGQQSNNPWLQEFPDPVTRVTWDNYLTVSHADAKTMGFKNWYVANGAMDGNYAKVVVNGTIIEKVPVLIQPGQAKGTAGLSFGYGRKKGLKDEMQTGVNAFALYHNFATTQNVSIEKVEGVHEFACLQLQNTLMGRGDIIRETTLETYTTEGKEHWNPVPEVSMDHQPVDVRNPKVDLWESFDRSVGHHFNMSIDLNACTGCGACVIACHAENNVPVVGKLEVRRFRNMHWLRIDRYYSSEQTFDQDNEKKESLSGPMGSKRGFEELERSAENPQVAFQPVMCQHCNHAPCETVCPVAATSHGRQGQNHMAYNRCVGTRYCANNCPYKVRRFNWFLYSENKEFDFHMNDDLGRMVLNPDVVVRSRGVMEKCSLCIQRTQKTILDAKQDGRQIKDGEFNTACSAACSSGAIVFGDINDPESKVASLKQDDRVYYLLEHVGTKPNVFYHVKVRNTQEG